MTRVLPVQSSRSARISAPDNFTHILSDLPVWPVPPISSICGTGAFVPLLTQMRRCALQKSQLCGEIDRSFQGDQQQDQTKEQCMPQTELQGLGTGLTSETAFRPGRRPRCTPAKEEVLASAARGICAEEHVFNWQSLWIDIGGEG
jgi:hypothetical protein